MWNSLLLSSASSFGNYFGSGADGDVTISSNTNITATQDGDMIVKNYNSLTINSSCTLTTDNRCKGLLVYVKGNCTINGTLTMTARGAYADPVSAGVSSTGLRIIRRKSGSTETLSASDLAGCGSAATTAESNQGSISGNGAIYTIPRTGAAGGAQAGPGGDLPGNAGSSGTGGQTGGGGSGGANTGVHSGAGGDGTCFSGGVGSGGTIINQSDASDIGGPGGDGSSGYNTGGGAGNPGGTGYNGGSNGGAGSGGILILIVGGNLTIGASGVISANGVAGGAGTYGGGGSGGGSIIALYAGTLSNSGSLTATAGAGGSSAYRAGGAGGAGSVQGPTVIDA